MINRFNRFPVLHIAVTVLFFLYAHLSQATLTEDQRASLRRLAPKGYLSDLDKSLLQQIVTSIPAKDLSRVKEEIFALQKPRTKVLVTKFLEQFAAPVVKPARTMRVAQTKIAVSREAVRLVKAGAMSVEAVVPARSPVRIEAPAESEFNFTIRMRSVKTSFSDQSVNEKLFHAVLFKKYSIAKIMVEREGASPYVLIPVERKIKQNFVKIGAMTAFELAMIQFPEALDLFCDQNKFLTTGPEFLSLSIGILEKKFAYVHSLLDRNVRLSKSKTVYLAAASCDARLQTLADEIVKKAGRSWTDNLSPLMAAALAGDFARVQHFLELQHDELDYEREGYGSITRDKHNALDIAFRQSLRASAKKRETYHRIVRLLLEHKFELNEKSCVDALRQLVQSQRLFAEALRHSSLSIVFDHDMNVAHDGAPAINYAFIWALRNNYFAHAQEFLDRGLKFADTFPALHYGRSGKIWLQLSDIKKLHRQIFQTVVEILLDGLGSLNLKQAAKLWEYLRNAGFYESTIESALDKRIAYLLDAMSIQKEAVDFDELARVGYALAVEKYYHKASSPKFYAAFIDCMRKIRNAEIEGINSLGDLEQKAPLLLKNAFGEQENTIELLRKKETLLIEQHYGAERVQNFPDFQSFNTFFKLEPIIRREQFEIYTASYFFPRLDERMMIWKRIIEKRAASLTTLDELAQFSTLLAQRNEFLSSSQRKIFEENGEKLFLGDLERGAWSSFEDTMRALQDYQAQNLIRKFDFYRNTSSASIMMPIFRHWFLPVVDEIRASTSLAQLEDIARRLMHIQEDRHYAHYLNLVMNLPEVKQNGQTPLAHKTRELFLQKLATERVTSMTVIVDIIVHYQALQMLPKPHYFLSGFEKMGEQWRGNMLAEIEHVSSLDDLEVYAQELRDNDSKFSGSIIYSDHRHAVITALHRRAFELFKSDVLSHRWTSLEETFQALTSYQERQLISQKLMNGPDGRGLVETIFDLWFDGFAKDFDEVVTLDQLGELLAKVKGVEANLSNPSFHARLEPVLLRMRNHGAHLFLQMLANNHFTRQEDAVSQLKEYQRLGLVVDDAALHQQEKELVGKIWAEIFRRFPDIFDSVVEEIRNYVLMEDYTAALGLKREAFEKGFVRNTLQFVTIMSELAPGAFNRSNSYLNKNSTHIFEQLPYFIDKQNSLRELSALRGFVDAIRLSDSFARQRAHLKNYLDNRIVVLKLGLLQKTYADLRLQVRALYEARLSDPTFAGDECTVQFYLLRDEHDWEADRRLCNAGTCVMLDDVDEAYPALCCKHHDQPLLLHVKRQKGCDCLSKLCKLNFAGVLTCGAQPAHELPVTDAHLRNEGLSEEQILILKIDTLMSYYQVLGGADKLPFSWCEGESCHHPIFENAIDERRNYYCVFSECEFCYDCKAPAHELSKCESELDALWRDPTSSMRPCPWCYTPFVKNDQCNHVRCQNTWCNKTFHFVRGKYRKDVPANECHDFNKKVNGVEQIPPRAYRVRREAGYQPGMESDFPERYGEFDPYR